MASSSSAGASKNTKAKQPRMPEQAFPVSTIGQGQGLLMGQAIPQAQPEERRSQETSEASLGPKGEKKSSVRSALSSIKEKAKRLSFSSSSSSKDHAALPESEEEFEKVKAKEVEEDKRRAE